MASEEAAGEAPGGISFNGFQETSMSFNAMCSHVIELVIKFH